MRAPVLRLALLMALAIAPLAPVRAQNLVTGTPPLSAAPATTVTAAQVGEVAREPSATVPAARDAGSRRVAAKLDAHVRQFLAGFPYRPFQNTLGISGHEIYFAHPDHLFYALSIALPYLSPATAAKTRAFLAKQLAVAPPYAVAGYDYAVGRARESYDVPPELRLKGRGEARSAFGIYAFWTYCRYAGDSAAARKHWSAIRARMQPLISGDYPFDVQRKDYGDDEPEKLNGDLAGLIGYARLARLNGDGAAERQALAAARRLLELRVNLERTNPVILLPTRTTTKVMHNAKLARYCDLAPEVGAALARWTDGRGAARLAAFRDARPAWYLAFGDRYIGGENYTSPPHMSHAMFAGAAFVERLDRKQLLGFVDVPWCAGDLYFMEKCAWALSASAQKGK